MLKEKPKNKSAQVMSMKSDAFKICIQKLHDLKKYSKKIILVFDNII